jgi:hypothetical protein
MTVVILAITGFLLFLTFVVGVWRMMLAVMLVRPSCDQIFAWMMKLETTRPFDLMLHREL